MSCWCRENRIPWQHEIRSLADMEHMFDGPCPSRDDKETTMTRREYEEMAEANRKKALAEAEFRAGQLAAGGRIARLEVISGTRTDGQAISGANASKARVEDAGAHSKRAADTTTKLPLDPHFKQFESSEELYAAGIATNEAARQRRESTPSGLGTGLVSAARRQGGA